MNKINSFHAYQPNIHSAAPGLSSNFDSQVLLFKKYMCKAIVDTAIPMLSLGKVNLKPEKEFIILDAIKNIPDSWEELKMST